MSEHEHFGPDCPVCQGASEAAKIIGGFGEAMQKMLDDGVFERMGYEMARRREEAVLEATAPHGAVLVAMPREMWRRVEEWAAEGECCGLCLRRLSEEGHDADCPLARRER